MVVGGAVVTASALVVVGVTVVVVDAVVGASVVDVLVLVAVELTVDFSGVVLAGGATVVAVVEVAGGRGAALF
jgi:hypothetical protein